MYATFDDELNRLLRIVGGDELDDLAFVSADRDLDFGHETDDDDEDAAFERWLMRISATSAARDRARLRH